MFDCKQASKRMRLVTNKRAKKAKDSKSVALLDFPTRHLPTEDTESLLSPKANPFAYIPFQEGVLFYISYSYPDDGNVLYKPNNAGTSRCMLKSKPRQKKSNHSFRALYDHWLAKPTANVIVRLNTIGAMRYCHAITNAIPSLTWLPLNSTMTITLLAVGVKKTTITTK